MILLKFIFRILNILFTSVKIMDPDMHRAWNNCVPADVIMVDIVIQVYSTGNDIFPLSLQLIGDIHYILK
jgi:hypothetical protein